MILNWNNKPRERGFAGADNEWSYGSVQRVDLLWAATPATKKHTLATLVGAMNLAATQDLRVVRVWPLVRAVLARGTSPTLGRDAAAQLVDDVARAGRQRLDVNLDGKIDDRRAAVLDAAWKPLTRCRAGARARRPRRRPRAADAARRRAGPRRLVVLHGLVHVRRQGPPHAARAPGAGSRSRRGSAARATVSACAAALWAAIDAAAATLEAARAPTPPHGVPTRRRSGSRSARASSPTRCAGRTGRRSSRSSRSGHRTATRVPATRVTPASVRSSVPHEAAFS